jgi:predicted amidohydrolase YtcJ
MTTPVGEAHYFLRRSFRDLTEGELPTREALDCATTEHPVVIQAWAPTTPNAMACNSMALDRLDITRATPDDVGRVHVEKGLTGHPTGRLLGSVNNYYSGEPFTDDLYRRLPTLQPRAIGPGTERAMRAYNALGVTALYDGHAMDFRDDRRVPVAPCREPADRARPVLARGSALRTAMDRRPRRRAVRRAPRAGRRDGSAYR